LRRLDVFARDEFRCVYCGQVFEPAELTLDHVQPRVRGGDGSLGNVVTACGACNTRKGHRRLAGFLRDEPASRHNFFRYATHVHRRHLRAIEEELARGGLTSLGD
jgi:5-methylcytosine-specific restriction endonuclease McrA